MIDRILPEQVCHGVTDDLVTAAEIPWALAPLPNLELMPLTELVTLDQPALLTYVLELQDEVHAIRTVLHAALGAVTLAHTQRDRLRRRVRQLVDALRAARGIGRDR